MDDNKKIDYFIQNVLECNCAEIKDIPKNGIAGQKDKQRVYESRHQFYRNSKSNS